MCRGSRQRTCVEFFGYQAKLRIMLGIIEYYGRKSSLGQPRKFFFYIIHNEILFLLLFISLFCYPLEILAVFGQRDILSEILAQRDRMRQL